MRYELNMEQTYRDTQQELANRTGTSKSYISRVENGLIEPNAGMFLKIISSLGLRFDIVKPIGY